VIVAVLDRRRWSVVGSLMMRSRTRVALRRGVCSHGRGPLHVVGHLRRHGGGAFGRRSHRLGQHGLRTALLLLGSSGWTKDVVIGSFALLRRGAALLLRVLGHCERQGLASNTSGWGAEGCRLRKRVTMEVVEPVPMPECETRRPTVEGPTRPSAQL
jgi:hypothetical protein